MDDLMSFDDHEPSPIATFLVGILLGCAVGAVAMLLLAPDKGSRTRRNIRKRGRVVQHDVEDAFGDAIGQVRRKARHGREAVAEKAESIYERGERVVDEQRERVADVMDAGKGRFRRKR